MMSTRWSESVSAYNLIDYCLKECPKTKPIDKIRYGIKKTIDEVTAHVGVKDVLDRINYVSTQGFTKELRDFIFDELKEKSEVADDSETAKEICSARGDWVLRHNNPPQSELLRWIEDVAYDESLLLWHIATELCYNTVEAGNNGGDSAYRNFCKVLSDYMLYLLVMQPTMMSAVSGIGRIRFRDTCAEAKKFFGNREWGQIGACKHILDVNTEVEPVAVKGDRSKSVLFDACRLAKHLRDNLEEEKKWVIMSKVWVEMLSYAASHCRAHNHAQQLSKGGELVTFVWLLMAHLGLGEQFQIKEGHARAKLIVDKYLPLISRLGFQAVIRRFNSPWLCVLGGLNLFQPST
ncbi:hypothetical protein L1049_010327 [Liquidambar formosana]|uniref:DUF4220 domain-containing protein n=1 Tax=Liquidambar formosana TaxID=63359 RepID=A0AAP0NA26_LIQFO